MSSDHDLLASTEAYYAQYRLGTVIGRAGQITIPFSEHAGTVAGWTRTE
ncbi:hypothetical protein [Halocatena salina]|uniref:Uncharacterized protein n=1 Tax=Halocatena salina TaxID=2934340 RepID=A0A8U0A134_9EURY|nr:hypothetical protein [Halocatena salina]UPM42784.1 hypothetical protein MW046_12600 [Halocatena salina]